MRESIGAIPGVGAVGMNGDPCRLTVEFDRGREPAARLLAELILRGVPVAAFTPETIDLEQAYLRAGIRQVD